MENQIICAQCEKTFDSEDALRQHSNVKHRKVIINEKRKVARKPILKYILVVLIIALVVGIGTHRISFSSDNKTQIGGMAASIATIGEKAPDFTLPSSNRNKISLSDYRGEKNVLLYFMEGVMCDPCWKQTLDIEKEYDKFQSKDIELITITVDPLNAVTKNAKRFGITLPILADEDLKVSSDYDVLKDAMHPGERPGHTFILVDKSGKVIWRKAYFLASGSTKMTMKMRDGSTMTMDMGMDMGKPGADLMYVTVDRLLEDLREGATQARLELTTSSAEPAENMNMSNPNMPMQDHSMCLTPIHNHVDFEMYVGGTPLNFSQNNYMDQSNEVHFHKTVKVKPDDVTGLPNGLLIHVHKESVTVEDFLKTLDLPFNIDGMQELKVYANGILQPSGLKYILKDKDRLLVADSSDEAQIKSQMDSVTDYAIQGKERNPSLFGGC